MLLALAVAGVLGGYAPEAAAAKGKGVSGKEARERVAEVRKELGKVVKKAREREQPTDSQLAKRLVAGQLKLADRDPEGAAIIFLDLIENYGQTDAARQALVYLGEALMALDMDKWAGECFGKNLADRNTEAARFHQRSLANLLRLAAPARQAGFAQRPGLSATPEVRARLQAIGVDVTDRDGADVGRPEAQDLVERRGGCEALPAEVHHRRDPARGGAHKLREAVAIEVCHADGARFLPPQVFVSGVDDPPGVGDRFVGDAIRGVLAPRLRGGHTAVWLRGVGLGAVGR